MEKEISEIQPITDNKSRIDAPDQKNIRPFKFKKWLKKKANKRYAVILLGAAISINIIAIVYQSSGDFLLATDNARLAAFFWTLSVVLAGFSAHLFSVSSRKIKKAKGKLKQESQNQPFLLQARHSIRGFVLSKTFFALFPILLLAFILRVIPIMKHGLLPDEWYWLDNARLILKGMIVSPFGFVGDQPSNFPAYPLALLLLIVRNPLLAVRLMGIIYSLITIFLVYSLVKKAFGFKAAVCGAILMAVSAWDIHMSGLGWLNVNPNPMLVAWLLLLLYRIWERKYTIWTLFWLAFSVAISVHLLYVAVLLIVPVGVTLLIHWVKSNSGKKLTEIVLVGLFFFVCISPLIPKLIQYPESVSRHGEFLQENLNMSGESKTTLSYYWEQVLLLREDYFRGETDFSAQGLWGITLDTPIQFLSVLGIVLIIIQTIRKKNDYFWLVVILTFFVQLFVPFVLLFRTSSVWRAYPIFPIVYLFAIYALVEISRSMKLITKKMIIDRKGLLTIFLTANMVLYFMSNFYWFSHFLSGYTKAVDMYETTICQAAAKIIGQKVPRGSTIYMPDEMCFTLVSILYDEDRYHFINVRLEDSKPNMISGDYVMILNSRQYLGVFNGDIQAMLMRELGEQQMEMVSPYSDSSPVLYLIK